MSELCGYCNGEGIDDLLPCPECDGTGGELLGYDDDEETSGVSDAFCNYSSDN